MVNMTSTVKSNRFSTHSAPLQLARLYKNVLHLKCMSLSHESGHLLFPHSLLSITFSSSHPCVQRMVSLLQLPENAKQHPHTGPN